MELLFGKRKRLAVELASRDGTVGMRELLAHLRDRELKERPELFMQKDTMSVGGSRAPPRRVLDLRALTRRFRSRPGILVLINEADWELDGGIDAKVKSGDTVTFISTLHGG